MRIFLSVSIFKAEKMIGSWSRRMREQWEKGSWQIKSKTWLQLKFHRDGILNLANCHGIIKSRNFARYGWQINGKTFPFRVSLSNNIATCWFQLLDLVNRRAKRRFRDFASSIVTWFFFSIMESKVVISFKEIL